MFDGNPVIGRGGLGYPWLSYLSLGLEYQRQLDAKNGFVVSASFFGKWYPAPAGAYPPNLGIV